MSEYPVRSNTRISNPLKSSIPYTNATHNQHHHPNEIRG